MTDLADLTEERLNIVVELEAGNPLPLAKWLEGGGELKDDHRALLIRFLRGGIKRKRGNRRTFSDDANAREVRTALQDLQRHFAIQFGSYRSYTRAIEAYQAMHPEMSAEKIKSYAKHGLLSKAYLESIDRARGEAKED